MQLRSWGWGSHDGDKAVTYTVTAVTACYVEQTGVHPEMKPQSVGLGVVLIEKAVRGDY